MTTGPIVTRIEEQTPQTTPADIITSLLHGDVVYVDSRRAVYRWVNQRLEVAPVNDPDEWAKSTLGADGLMDLLAHGTE
jgi:hypothetical protein